MVVQKKKKKKKKEFLILCCSIFEWGTKKGLEFKAAHLSIMFFVVKFWNFVGLICLLFVGRLLFFKNYSTGVASPIYNFVSLCAKYGIKKKKKKKLK